jgi:hypothetical protein
MSLHYEWFLSFRLRPDTPDAFVEELRYHLGLSGLAPETPTLDIPDQGLAPDSDGDELAGGSTTRLVRRRHGNWPETWGVFARLFVLDDAMYELVQVVPPWLAPWSLTQGWVGMAREELDLNPWLNFYVADGYAYASSPGGLPEPLTGDAPPFAITQTTEPWPPTS